MSIIAQASALALLPLHTRNTFAASQLSQDTIIDAVEVIKLTGTYKTRPGLYEQHQVKAIDVYDDQRPAPYADNPNGKETETAINHYYVRIRTKGGLAGLYGLIDLETVSPILKQLRPFLLGKDALAVETLWDQLYRNNRNSRAGHYMTALSAFDNALWDLRGKRFNAPEVCPLVEYLILHVGSKMHFQKDPPLTTNGILPLRHKPGFGIDLDDSKIEQLEVLTS